MSAVDTSDNGPKRDNHTPSCAVCQRRKVKCNRVYPCAPCQKIGLVCEFKPREQHGRKRQKRTHDEANRASAGIRATTSTGPRNAVDPALAAQGLPDGDSAQLVSDGSGFRYMNNHLWSAMSPADGSGSSPATMASDSTPRPALAPRAPSTGISGNSIYESVLQDSQSITGGALQHEVPPPPTHFVKKLFMFSPPDRTRFGGPQLAGTPQPPAHQVIQLWQTYLTNVDPVMKVFHAPSMQQTVLGQIGKAHLAPSLQALTFAIYFVSTVSMQEDECEALLGSPRAELSHSFREATESALTAARFVTTFDLVVLQAFILYLAALRSLGETPLVWSLMGLAIRVAGTMGLARDGSILHLPPYECEMRRRLWWAMVYLDARSAELVGQDGDLLVQKYDVHLPANLNDTQLFPKMARLPESRPAATEVSYVLLRAMLASHLRGAHGASGPAGTWQRMRATNVPIAEKASIVEELERRLEEEILRFCDPTVPLQAFVINSAQTIVVKMRLVGNIPTAGHSAGSERTDGYSDNLFELSMRMMQIQLDLFGDPSLQKWRWHWQGQFQWYAFAELIRQLRLRQNSPDTVKAWCMIRKVFDQIIPTLELAPQKSPLADAARSLLHTAINAQARSQEAAGEAAQNPVKEPSQHQMHLGSNGLGTAPHNALLPAMEQNAPAANHDAELDLTGIDAAALNFDYDAIDWAEFDRLTTELCS